ncbi:MAG: hypothetical protein LBV41_06465 [Cytophagaceae bacterium]|jgi:hypothetical protein|nr:hypothetical protein [Cytophagaceae bacterium]
MKKTIVLLLFLMLNTALFGQYYRTGSDPARLQWRQIKTPYVRLVFEKNFEPQALRLAAVIDSIAPLVQGVMKHRPKRMDLLVHNNMSYSNGMLSWAPKRMEFFAVPHQNILSTDWLDELAIHEYRHAVQASKLNKGITKVFTFITGQHAVGGVLGYSLPMWFLEGDAVATETTLTPSGRGRSFDFNMELKAQLVERGVFSFDKAYMGSYREKVPNYYKMGYPLVAMARREYGAELWEKAVDETGRRNLLSQMNRSLKRSTTMRSKQLYETMFARLRQSWSNEVNSQILTGFEPVTLPDKEYKTYRYIKAINDSIVVAELTGQGIRSQIVEINQNTSDVKTLAYTGLREEDPISANADMVVWAELQYDFRWENESFSVVRIYNRTTDKLKTLGKKMRLFAPAVHPRLPLIAAVEATTDYRFFVTIIDALTGNTVQRIPAPDNQFVLTPSWNVQGENLIALLLNHEGKALYTLNTETEAWTQVSPYAFDEKCHPVQLGNHVWYAANGNVSREIFCLDIATGENRRLTSSRYGADFPTIAPSAKMLFYSDYTDRGYQPVRYVETGIRPNGTEHGSSFIELLAADIAKQEQPYPTDTVMPKQYKVEKYSKLNLVNIHSWMPAYANINNKQVSYGVSLMSQNLLGTSIFTTGLNLDPSQRHQKAVIDYSYYGFYPVIGVNFSYGDDNYSLSGLYRNETDTFTLFANQKIRYYRVKPGVNLPFDFSSGNFQRKLTLQTRLNFEYQSGYTVQKEYYTATSNAGIQPTGARENISTDAVNFFGMDYSIYFYNLRRGTSRDAGTRMGQTIQLIYGHTPWGNMDAGSIAGVYTRLFLPGILRYHAISIDNAFQFIADGEKLGSAGEFDSYRRFTNATGYPRGCTNLYGDRLYMLKTNYAMPLFNPDFSLGRFAYIKRIRMNLFCDFADARYTLTNSQTGKKQHFGNTFASFGSEVNVDVHLMRFILPFSIGYRAGYRTAGTSEIFHEAILSTSFGNYLVN